MKVQFFVSLFDYKNFFTQLIVLKILFFVALVFNVNSPCFLKKSEFDGRKRSHFWVHRPKTHLLKCRMQLICLKLWDLWPMEKNVIKNSLFYHFDTSVCYINELSEFESRCWKMLFTLMDFRVSWILAFLEFNFSQSY